MYFSKNYEIKKTCQNLLDLRLHFVYSLAWTTNSLFLDQVKHILLEALYEWLGKEAAFHIWMSVFLLENLGTKQNWENTALLNKICSGLRLLFNIIILSTAIKKLPEFSGYKGRRYPGQLPPPPPVIQPRRMELPPNFVEEWKNIGSRRTEFLDLGFPRFQKQKKILVSKRMFSYMKIDNDDDDFVSVSEWANSKDEILNNDKNDILL